MKITKKPCKSITRETELLGLVHSDLGDLKHTMTRGGKRFYVIFVDDHSRFTKLYLLRLRLFWLQTFSGNPFTSFHLFGCAWK